MGILVVGLSTRAIAESAVRGGHQITALDFFGDRDQRALVENYALQRDFDLPFSARALLRASRSLDFDAVVYVSNLENHPSVVEALSRGRRLLGNAPEVLRRVRDPRTLRAVCRDAGIPLPTTLLPGEEDGASPTLRWLRKPVLSGGGHGIRLWDGEPLPSDHVLQAYVAGMPASAAFVADGEQSVVLGLTEQLIGREELGAGGFGWCGNILPPPDGLGDTTAVLRSVEAMVGALTRRFQLRGVNGIDLVIAREDSGPKPYLVEVNPRYTASMELLEQVYGLNIFECHLAAMEGHLLDFSLADRLQSGHVYFGKGIVYARRTVTAPETAGWVEHGRRDIPFPGERIEAGHPVCSVLAEGESRAECWQNLLANAGEVRRETQDL